MMTGKKTMAMIMAVMMGMGLSAGGGYEVKAAETENLTEEAETEYAEAEVQEIAVPVCGISFFIEQKYLDMGLAVQAYLGDTGYPTAVVYYYYKDMLDQRVDEFLALPAEEQTDEAVDEFYADLAAHTRYLMTLTLVEKEIYEEKTAEGVSLEELTGMENTEEFGENDGYVYLISEAEPDTEGMDETEREQYEACLSYLPTLRETAVFTDVEEQEAAESAFDYPAQMPSFTTKDLAGNEVTETIFAEKDLTVINIWGTFCTPCIGEMPELGEWVKEMPENVQLIGLVMDIAGEDDSEHLELAGQIMEKAGADFVNLIPTEEMNELLASVVGVPTTIFVDKTGALVGEPIVGADVNGYKAFVEEFSGE